MASFYPDKICLMADNDPTPALFQFFTEIGIIEQLISSKLEGLLPDGLKVSQFVVLNHLVRLQGKWSPARLADAFQVTRAAMTNTLGRLESRGLIKIEADPVDGRGKLVSLSPVGQEMHTQCVANIGPFLVDIEQAFGEQKIRLALPLLEEIRNYLDLHR